MLTGEVRCSVPLLVFSSIRVRAREATTAVMSRPPCGGVRRSRPGCAWDHDYLDSDVAAEAIAAVAVVASQLRGGTKVTSASASDFVLAGGRLELADDVPDLAVQSLDRIVGEASEWRELWHESDDSASAFATVQQLRTTIKSILNG